MKEEIEELKKQIADLEARIQALENTDKLQSKFGWGKVLGKEKKKSLLSEPENN